MKKKIITLNFIALLALIFTGIKVNCYGHLSDLDYESNEASLNDDATVSEKIYNTLDDVDTYLDELYSDMDTVYISSQNSGVLTLFNVDQDDLKEDYNALGDLRHDLNHDGVINDNDNIGDDGGICQPVAVTMALRFMTWRNCYSYVPKINSDTLDEINIFYDVVDEYISNGWGGAGASRRFMFYIFK